MDLREGLDGHVELTVTDGDTAIAMGSGDVPVLATPRVVALAEEAACAAVAGALADGDTSVGTRVELDHLSPTAVGATVRAAATLEQVEGRRLRFGVEVHEGDDLVARATHVRVVVRREGFGGS